MWSRLGVSSGGTLFEILPQDLGERFFQELADFVGCSVEEEVGNGWAENVHSGGIVRDALDNGPACARNARKLLSPSRP